MTLIKVSDNRIMFEHPLVLDPDKKYKLAVSHMMCSIKQTFRVDNFHFSIYIPIPTTTENFMFKSGLTGTFTIRELETELQKIMHNAYSLLTGKMEKDKKTAIINALNSAMVTPVKFRIQKATNYVTVLNVPFLLTVVSIGNFAKTFKFENTFWEKENILYKAAYVSGNILEILKPLSAIEWHCNITEYSYSNNDHPHIHKQEELLHISFTDNNFYENPVYKESSKKIIFIPLRKDCGKSEK